MIDFEDDIPVMGLGKRSGPAPDGKAHERFRARKAWKDFSAQRREAVGYRCELCGGVYRGALSRKLQVHHRDEENYEDLTPDKFKVLCYTCHSEIVETWVTRLNGSKFIPGPMFLYWYGLLKDFLSFPALARAQEWVRKIEAGEIDISTPLVYTKKIPGKGKLKI